MSPSDHRSSPSVPRPRDDTGTIWLWNQAYVAAINTQRRLRGLPDLAYLGPLVGWCCYICEDNARRNTIDHIDSLGRWPYQRYPGAAEILAAGYPTFGDAVGGWLRSTAGHREVLLSRSLSRCGVGWASAVGGPWPWTDGLTRWWTVMFV